MERRFKCKVPSCIFGTNHNATLSCRSTRWFMSQILRSGSPSPAFFHSAIFGGEPGRRYYHMRKVFFTPPVNSLCKTREPPKYWKISTPKRPYFTRCNDEDSRLANASVTWIRSQLYNTPRPFLCYAAWLGDQNWGTNTPWRPKAVQFCIIRVE